MVVGPITESTGRRAFRTAGVALWILAMGPITQASIVLIYLTAGSAYTGRLLWAALGGASSIVYLAALVMWLRRRWARASVLFTLSLLGPWWLWPPSALVPAVAAVVASLVALYPRPRGVSRDENARA